MKSKLPAEWEEQQFVLLSFPRTDGDFGSLTNEVAIQHFELAATICRYTPVLLLVADQDLLETSRQLYFRKHPFIQRNTHQVLPFTSVIQQLEEVDIIEGFEYPLFAINLPTNDVWARDFGPLTVFNAKGKPKLLDFTFNGWGNKYPANLDNQVTARLHKMGIFGNTSKVAVDVVLEGGGVESDGAGTVMTTRKSLLNTNRNPEMNEADLIDVLKVVFYAEQIILLDHGHLENDDTDGHVDTIVRFAPNNAIVYQACDDPNDDHYKDFKALEEQLKQVRNVTGEAYTLHALPWPPAIFSREDGRRLPASYANFLITNGAVIVPAIHEKRDSEAVAVLEAAFPNHAIVLQAADYLLEQHGSIHCLTMQLPMLLTAN